MTLQEESEPGRGDAGEQRPGEHEPARGAPGSGPWILAVDDEPDVVDAVRRILSRGGFRVATATSGQGALNVVDDGLPDLALLDIRMPGMNGYELCSTLVSRAGTEPPLPVVFLTALDSDQDRKRAFEVGGSDFLTKPMEPSELLRTVRKYLQPKRAGRGDGTRDSGTGMGLEETWGAPSRFPEFVRALARDRDNDGVASSLLDEGPTTLYERAGDLGIPQDLVARRIADFLGIPLEKSPDVSQIELGVLSSSFCRANHVLPLQHGADSVELVLANPFDGRVMEALERVVGAKVGRLAVAPPDVFEKIDVPDSGDVSRSDERSAGAWQNQGSPEAEDVGREILVEAVRERATDIHFRPRTDKTDVRFRVDGDMRDVRALSPAESRRVISRLKALAGMDIAERRRPQDGVVRREIEGRPYKLRLATSVTPDGESLVIRLIDPEAGARELSGLGMTDEQSEAVLELANRSQGLVLVVGPTGSGKSTTIFSILSRIDTRQRSVISVEDPVEYDIPHVNQQQVNEAAGVTFETLLRSAVRQDPDILYLGEIRDLTSAKAALDFASSGHLTITTVHSASATTAIFRLERLGVLRGALADATLCIIAQKLLKTLCPDCREVHPTTEEEAVMLRPYTDRIPDQVASPDGCRSCRGTGFRGRTGIFEILRFDPEVVDMVRRGDSIATIRSHVRSRGDFLVSNHAVEKVRNLVLSPRQVYEQVLLEEGPVERDARTEPRDQEATDGNDGQADGAGSRSLLVVDDDENTRMLLERLLGNAGYDVTLAGDGADALLKLGQRHFDAILSDIDMPNLDGLKLLEVVHQQEVRAPVVFLTGQTGQDVEARALDLGARDFIRKPVQKEVLLMRMKRVLPQEGP